jgi:Notch-like protein
VQIAKKTSNYMNVWMYVIREFEDAIDDCQAGCIDCNDDPVHAWDEGVAFYAGSLEGTDGSGSGVMCHNLADKRAGDFGTSTAADGKSAVNEALLVEFKMGQAKLQQGKCGDIRPIITRIVALMSVPLVQGSLRYAYRVGELQGQGDSKLVAEGAAFSAAILPRVHACDASAAKVIADNMDIDSGSTPMSKGGFAAVKTAFESVYSCLGMTCKHVGGLFVTAPTYHVGAEPCVDPTSAPTEGTSTASFSVHPRASFFLGVLILAHACMNH